MAIIRLQYQKTETLKYIAHLDTLRAFIRALRRAQLPIAYSQGFNPHPTISFLMPLSLGFTSDCELVDIGFAEDISFDEAARRLDDALPPGFHILKAYAPVSKAGEIAEAEYTVSFRGEAPTEQEVSAFFARPALVVEKRSKRGMKETDIMPMIHAHSYRDACLTLRLSAGSTDNLNPELVMTHFYPERDWDYQICRRGIYTEKGQFC